MALLGIIHAGLLFVPPSHCDDNMRVTSQGWTWSVEDNVQCNVVSGLCYSSTWPMSMP